MEKLQLSTQYQRQGDGNIVALENKAQGTTKFAVVYGVVMQVHTVYSYVI
jgi:hypothetical protein